MIKGKILLVLIMCIPIVFSSYGQENTEKKFIQFIFTNLETPETAKTIKDQIKAQEGVYMVRANFNSRKTFLFYYSDSDIKLSKVYEWLMLYGIEYTCINDGVHGKYKDIDLQIDCEK